MTTVIMIVASVTATAAAVRSTWSPCGLSMLSTITPLAERGRGHRFGATAAWFVVGASLGGATLGLPAAALASVVRTLHPGAASLGAIAAAALLVAAASDRRLGGFRLPVHHRQVNERWLDQFRPWVYGAGFGWQIGTGLATYIVTVAVYAVVLLGALTADPAAAVLLCTLFGTVRGLCVLLGRRLDTPAALWSFHRRFDAIGPVSRDVMVAVETASAAALVGEVGLHVSPSSPGAVAVGAVAVGAVVIAMAIGALAIAVAVRAVLDHAGRGRRRGRRRDQPHGQPSAAAMPWMPDSTASRPLESRTP